MRAIIGGLHYNVEAVMETAIDKMEASAKRKYGGAILRKKKEKENE